MFQQPVIDFGMDETHRRRIMVTSSFNEMSVDQLGNRVVERGGGTPPDPTPFYKRASGEIFKDDTNGFFPP
jgi:hypothetical protein